MNQSIGVNTGRKIYRWLKEIDMNTGEPTGNRKPNVLTDPDYVAPVIDYVTCPINPKETNDSVINLFWPDVDRASRFDERYIQIGKEVDQYIVQYELNQENSFISESTDVSIYISTNKGQSWSLFIDSLKVNSFTDSLEKSQSKWYRAVISSDSVDTLQTIQSNILKVNKVTTNVGDLHLVFNSIEHSPFGEIEIQRALPDSDEKDEFTFLIKNNSVGEIVELVDLDYISQSSQISCAIIDENNHFLDDSKYITRPQLGDKINRNGGWRALVVKELQRNLLYYVRVAVATPDQSQPTAIFWWVFKVVE